MPAIYEWLRNPATTADDIKSAANLMALMLRWPMTRRERTLIIIARVATTQSIIWNEF